MKLTDFEFHLPPELIAKHPVDNRSDSRLMVLGQEVEHRKFTDLPDYFNAGDVLVLNNTKVLPCRLRGIKRSGNPLEVTLVREISKDEHKWEVLSAGGYNGPLEIADGLSATIHKGLEATLHYEGDLRELLLKHGEMPLPPYLKRRATAEDLNWYQTVYANCEGSIAAPTAGLHFTDEVLNAIRAKGVSVHFLTLHVGKGTFMPIRAQNIMEHEMLSEVFEIPKEVLSAITERTGRLITVGTTTTRALEGYLSGQFTPLGDDNPDTVRGSTNIFITPGYKFNAIDALLTNFHLPGSTPLMLASALCGRESLLSAYKEAIAEKYRFFSYGDAMLIYYKQGETHT
jgi:S-adenosylmethionine:tRNA ribosyltransferase-isomerase